MLCNVIQVNEVGCTMPFFPEPVTCCTPLINIFLFWRLPVPPLAAQAQTPAAAPAPPTQPSASDGAPAVPVIEPPAVATETGTSSTAKPEAYGTLIVLGPREAKMDDNNAVV